MHRRTVPWLIGVVAAACLIGHAANVLADMPKWLAPSPKSSRYYKHNGFLYLGYGYSPIPSVTAPQRLSEWRAAHPQGLRLFHRQPQPQYDNYQQSGWTSNSRREF